MRSPASSSHTSPAPTHPRAALRAVLAALGARGVSPTGRAVFTALWTFADPRGRAWPSQETLARLTGRCVRTVRTAVNELARAGAIVRDVPDLAERRRRRRTTAYLLTLDGRPLAARPPAAPPGPPPAGADPDAPALAWGEPAEVDLDAPSVVDDGGAPPAEPPAEAPDAPAADTSAPSITGNEPPPITGNHALQKTPGMNTSARPTVRRARPSPFAAPPRPGPAAVRPAPTMAAPLAAVAARCWALAR